jgi:altronate hydrolase
MHLNVLQLDPRDNALIALTDLKAGERVEFGGLTYTLLKNVPAKHKFAMRAFGIADDVIMYGVLVGRAVKPIAAGELLTTSNIQHQAAPFREQLSEFRWAPPDVSRWNHQTFLGYHRSDGQVGTRNYWLVVPKSTAAKSPNWQNSIGKERQRVSIFMPSPQMRFHLRAAACSKI